MRLALVALAWSLVLPLTSALAQAVPDRGAIAVLSSTPGAGCGRDQPQQDDSVFPADYERQASSKDPCAVADDNLAREEAEILKSKPPATAASLQKWDHTSRPQYLGAIL